MWDKKQPIVGINVTTAGITLNNSSLAALAKQAAPYVLNAIKTASAKTGVSFAYMLEKASSESGFDAAAKSVSSTATGLYQFIDKTWLNLVKKYGGQAGLGQYANAIDDNGHVANAAVKKQILALRKDPAANAMMAAEYTAENKGYLQQQLGSGTTIGPTELGLAHFLGAGGAAQFLKAYQSNPVQQASDLFPKAANANHNIFYDSKTGSARSLAGIYDLFAQKFGGSTKSVSPAPTSSMVASATPVAAAPATTTSTQALTQVLADDVNMHANATSSLVYADGAGSTMLADHEMVHWFTARQVPTDISTASANTTSTATITSSQANASLNPLSPAFTANPTDMILLSQARDAYTAYLQRQSATQAYTSANS